MDKGGYLQRFLTFSLLLPFLSSSVKLCLSVSFKLSLSRKVLVPFPQHVITVFTPLVGKFTTIRNHWGFI